MALDPSISLQAGKIPQAQGMLGGVERGMKLQQLAMQPAILEQQLATSRQAELASRASTAITQAQLPGVQAESALKVKAADLAAAKVKAAQNAFDFDADGNPVLDPNTNQPKFNLAKYQYGLHSSGQFDEALKAGADVLKQSKDAYDFLSTARTQAALAAQAAHDKTPGTPAQKAKAAEATWKDMTGRAVASAGEIGLAISPDQFRYTPGLEKALYTAAINPATQESLKQGLAAQDIQRDQLALQVDQFDNSKKLNFTDEASLDPNSQVSQMAREIARNTGMKVDDRMSAGDIHRNDLTKAVLTSTGAAAGVARQAAQEQVSLYSSTRQTLELAKDVLAKSGITPLQLLQNKVSGRLLDNPNVAALQAQLRRLPPGLVTEGQGYDTLKQILDAQLAQANANTNVAVGGTAVPRPEAPKTGETTPGKFTIGTQYKDKETGIIYRYTGKGKTGFEEVK
jgi:hypothetical protein